MKTTEILSNIKSNGGFDNFNKWTTKQIVEYIKANYPCSTYVAQKVANLI
jgi:hypothetical protein